MIKTSRGFIITLILSSSAFTIPVFAETNDEKMAFAGYLEETLGHFWAIERNLDENNAELAIIHATHPIAELYDLMKPELEEHDTELDAKIRQTLFELREKTTSNVTREQAQEAIEQAKDAVTLAREEIVGEEGNKMSFKISLIKGLLETSIAEYSEAVSDGEIHEMAEFQDGSAFVWRSQQIYDTIENEVPEHEAEEIEEFYEEMWAAYDERADPSTIETLANGIIHELEVVSGIESKVTELSDYVVNIRDLLTEVKKEYEKGETSEALSLATKAYLDNYEFLEAAVGAKDPELNKEIEYMMREELRDMIKSGVPASKVSAHIDEILAKMDKVAVIVPEFGTIALVVLAIATITIIVIANKNKRLSIIPKL